MEGESIEQAKSALYKALTTLSEHDRFNILGFSNQPNPLFPSSMSVTPDNLHLAREFIADLNADGGTEMAPALELALANNDQQKHELRQVIFITDGAVGNEQFLFDLIANHLGDSRLFTVGIGSAPNSYFMTRAARVGKGTFTYIGSQKEVASKMTDLLDKLSSPVLTNIQLQYPDGTIPDYWPANLPDLYAGEPVMVSIRQQKQQADELIISAEQGRMAERKQLWRQSIALNRQFRQQQAGLDLLWARQQIDELELNKTAANRPKTQQQVTALAMKYHLVSPYTSLVAVDVTPASTQELISRLAETKLMPPAGWQPRQGARHTMPKTATDSLGQLWLGLLLILIGFSGYYFTVKRQGIPQ